MDLVFKNILIGALFFGLVEIYFGLDNINFKFVLLVSASGTALVKKDRLSFTLK